MESSRTQVAVIGAGPAGLALANLLRQQGIGCVVLEAQSRAVIERTPRAGFLEEWAARALDRHGLAGRPLTDAPRHSAVEFRFDGARQLFPYTELTGHHHIAYPQQILVTDLVTRYVDAGGDARFEVRDVELHDTGTDHPSVTWTDPADGTARRLDCDFVAGCDGARGVSRQRLTTAGARVARHDYGVGWLTLLAETPPSEDRVILGIHPRGFAAHMPRGVDVTRFYLQCRKGDTASDWSDERAWAELHARLDIPGGVLREGRLIEKRVLDMHNYMVEPMALGRLHLAGDAAHMIAPIGAKGMNLALYDALHLARAYGAHYREGDDGPLATYSDTCLAQAWEYQEFSQWLSEVYHGQTRGEGDELGGTPGPSGPAGMGGTGVTADRFRAQNATARLRRLFSSRTAATAFAELYTGRYTNA
ncbi:4-hydroxybenzoate 3-monooxygenase [Streptomyces sp. NPDC088400]|uniref:4-hydroxybenzoate 3-monooxygenase n=1 Tax=Streptomyces sp. NPDC088400 TaxID=3365861 RepID=UPI003807E261